MNKYKVSRYNFETKETVLFNDLKAAAASIETNQEPWKVEMLISYAIVARKKAFKYGWRKVVEK